MTLEQLRERDAKRAAAFYAGETDIHPRGVSGKRWLIPPENDRRCMDTHPRAYSYSEWGNLAGISI
jgi:hypothetical protein